MVVGCGLARGDPWLPRLLPSGSRRIAWVVVLLPDQAGLHLPWRADSGSHCGERVHQFPCVVDKLIADDLLNDHLPLGCLSMERLSMERLLMKGLSMKRFSMNSLSLNGPH